MREIVLDTETTGFDPYSGHRLVEIGCVELINHMPSGNTYHQYINPERDVPEEVVKVHGLDNAFLDDKPKFAEVVDDFLAFIGDDKLVIHNAEFDMKFLNAELGWLDKAKLPMDQAIDTLKIAREKFPGERVNLDALCRKYGVDNSNRTKHGALLDSELLAEVYLELIGGREPGLLLKEETGNIFGQKRNVERKFREPRNFLASEEEQENHNSFMEKKVLPNRTF